MKYSVIFDESRNSPLQTSVFECEDDLEFKVKATSIYNNKPGLYTIYRGETQVVQFSILEPIPTKTTDSDTDILVKKMKSILRSHMIRMSIGACGCCESPWIAFEYQDEKILDIKGHSLDMFDE